MGIDTVEFLSPYSYVTVAAVQMVYHEDVVASTPEDRVKEVTLGTIMPVKAAFHDAMLVSCLVHIHNNCPICGHLRRHRQSP